MTAAAIATAITVAVMLLFFRIVRCEHQERVMEYARDEHDEIAHPPVVTWRCFQCGRVLGATTFEGRPS